MKKRLLATFLALCLVIGLLPAGVMAADMTVEGDRSEKLDFDGGTHTVTLRNLTIDDPSGVGSSAIDIHNGAQVTLILEGYNTLRGDLNKPVIWVEAGSSLTIEGPGTLDVSGNGTLSNGAAAIGGAYDDDEFGDITINGGTVIATGVGGGAGIGGGYKVASGTQRGNITINGGWVKAVGGHVGASTGAGIGSGENANFAGNIVINGGVVYAAGGGDNAVSIGAGGKGIGDPSEHGSFSTGVNGNAVIVAPNGIGATQNYDQWDGIFVSYSGSEATATVSNDGTVVLNDTKANIQVWGDPVVDYDLKVENGTTLRVVANDRNYAPSSLTMEDDVILTNHGTINVANSGISGDTSKLILMGGKEKTDGNGDLTVGKNGAVQVPLTKGLVTVTGASDLTYIGTAYTPAVKVDLTLWNYSKEYKVNNDYTRDDKDNINAGTASIVLTATQNGDLLGGTVTIEYEIGKADFDLGIVDGSIWTIQQGADGQKDKLPKPDITIDESIHQSDLSVLRAGTLTWYKDPERTEEVTDDWLKSLPESDNTEIYGSYTHGDSNFVNPKDVKITLKVDKYPVPDVTVSGPDVTGKNLITTYGDLKNEQLSVSITVNGNTQRPYSSVTWESSDEDVAQVDQNGLVTFVGAGAATITATVAEYDGVPDGSYAEARGTVTVRVQPRPITVTSVTAVDREYNGSKNVEVRYTLAEDTFRDQEMADGKIVLSVTGTMTDAAPGEDKPVTVYYSLTGPGHENYSLPQTGTTTVTIWEKSDPGVTPEEGTLTITNNLQKTYLFHLDELNPDVGSGDPLGNVIYVNPKVEVDAGSPYEGAIKARIVGETLIVTVPAVDTSVEESIGAVKVDLVTENYGSMTGTIDLNTKNLDLGHSYGDITIKNVLSGDGADGSDRFSYTIKLENEPLSGSTAAFDEPVAYRGTGVVEGGNGTTVTPDADGIIRFTLAGGEEITFSGNLNQDHKINYVITQLDSNGYTTTVTKAGDFTNGAVLPVSNPATGYLHCDHGVTGPGNVLNEWAEIVFTNAKGSVQGGNLTYHANNGSGDTVVYYVTDPETTVSKNLFSKVDYTFDSWNTAADGSGTEYMPGSSITMNGNVDLYAQWVKNGGGDGGDGDGGDATQSEFELHYVTNGGKHLSVESEIRVWTKDYEDLPVPVREGYTFEGWYWDLRLTNRVTGDVKVDVPVVVLYAKWSEDEEQPVDTGVSRWLDTENHTAYLSGYPDGTFGTDRNMTRAEVAQMFYALLLDKDVEITTSFSDVPADAWYAKAVNTLSSLGMLGGYPDGTYRPDAPITRAEFAAVALAFARESASASCSYTDVSTNAWYYTYVAQASTYGWIGGYPDNTFRPDNKITRAEVCVIVNNMLGRAADQRYIDRNADELTSFADLTSNHWAYYTVMEATNSHKYSVDDGVESWSRVN